MSYLKLALIVAITVAAVVFGPHLYMSAILALSTLTGR